jgi:hypothetical protein
MTTRLDHCVKVTVPGTTDVNKEALDVQQTWVRRTLERLSRLFGGATAINGQGGWMSETHGLIVEPVVIVYAYCDKAALENYLADVIAYARNMGCKMGQECVAVEIDGILDLIDTGHSNHVAA